MQPTIHLLSDFSYTPYTDSPCRLLSAPAGRWFLPMLSLHSFLWLNAPVPRCLPWCICLFLPIGHRPSPRERNGSANHHTPHTSNFNADANFAVLGDSIATFMVSCLSLQICLPPRSLLPQWFRVHRAAVAFTSKQNMCRYLHMHWTC